ncbi:response regulator [Mangrovibacterium marinum]|uniref:CheY-like chemotaxis protein n=1 Tax=Mangrovibacterium marinum TaxID=1639118 RepID=A0A2T5C4B5_9BACT|nr:response regulator [Mangrovibacterium marinum]PTN09642.1 CheY-like chemotaxis protein [Mangrovibacterium marinum]
MADQEDLKRLKLLIADDSPLNHRLVSISLRGRMVHIDSAYDGMEAFEMYQQNGYDVILMDLNMPKLNGSEAAEMIRKFEADNRPEAHCLIIAMTASDFDDDIQTCLEKGMDAYLGKPFLADKFLQIVSERLKVLS